MPANLENPEMAKRLEKINFPYKLKEKQYQKYSNYHTILLVSHAGKIMLKILQARLQQHMNGELPMENPAI